MIQKRLFAALLLNFCLLVPVSGFADESPAGNPQKVRDAEASLHYQTGKIVLKGGLATLDLPAGFKYLDSANAGKLLTEIWGNPPGQKTLGMLMPADMRPTDGNSWGVVITYEEDGHISDEDADKTNYDELLSQIRKSIAEENEERKKSGYETVEISGWAEKPYYDKAAKKLYWAKDLRFGNDTEHTLNYNIRILGRKGVLVLNAVSAMSQFSGIKKDMEQVVAFTNFDSGNRYADFDPKVDKMAEYGIAALIAGGVAAKMGFFAKLIPVLLALKKLVIVALVGVAAMVRKFFGKLSGKTNPTTPAA